MIGISMLYICVASACITLAAIFVERALRESRFPARLVWVVAMLATLICVVWIPSQRLASAQRPAAQQSEQGNAWTSGTSQAIRAVRSVLPRPSVITINVSQTSTAARVDAILMMLWATASALTLMRFVVGAARLRRIESTAEQLHIDGVNVLMTAETGPLTFGLVRPRILLPKWISELGAHGRNLVIVHEREHVRRADPALLLCGAAMTVIMPWNPAMWYMLARLRQAVELDCDSRVLRAHPDRKMYADLLLSIAGRASGGLLPVAGLAFLPSSLERRFLLMTEQSKRVKAGRVAMMAGAAVLLVGATAMIPRPEARIANSVLIVRGPGDLGGQATGRVSIKAISDSAAYRVYSSSGAFARFGELPRTRSDTLSGTVYSNGGAVIDFDVTHGAVYIVSADTSWLHVEAAMLGNSPAGWVSASGKHVVIDSGGVGITAF